MRRYLYVHIHDLLKILYSVYKSYKYKDRSWDVSLLKMGSKCIFLWLRLSITYWTGVWDIPKLDPELGSPRTSVFITDEQKQEGWMYTYCFWKFWRLWGIFSSPLWSITPIGEWVLTRRSLDKDSLSIVTYSFKYVFLQ